MSGTRYPLNLAEMCWRLGLRKPELIEAMHTEHQAQVETIRVLTEQLEALKDGSEVSVPETATKSDQVSLSETTD
jgi:hemerythrin-like domain-containing protein